MLPLCSPSKAIPARRTLYDDCWSLERRERGSCDGNVPVLGKRSGRRQVTHVADAMHIVAHVVFFCATYTLLTVAQHQTRRQREKSADL